MYGCLCFFRFAHIIHANTCSNFSRKLTNRRTVVWKQQVSNCAMTPYCVTEGGFALAAGPRCQSSSREDAFS